MGLHHRCGEHTTHRCQNCNKRISLSINGNLSSLNICLNIFSASEKLLDKQAVILEICIAQKTLDSFIGLNECYNWFL